MNITQTGSNNSMIQQDYTIRFTTPAFLGNAEQAGQWRTPPFKALLRQWWRVVWAEAHDYSNDFQSMRRDENHLFGSASDGTSTKSLVRIRLDKWDMGKKYKWEKVGRVNHPEVNNGMAVDTALYLGYGPIKKAGELKNGPAIDAQESAMLRLAFPAEEQELLDRAVALMGWYGSIGGRSRNGWGSFMLETETGEQPGTPSRYWEKCLDREWPHAIGKNTGGELVWWTNKGYSNWQGVINALAKIKVDLRTSFPFTNGKTQSPEDRHWLSYPVSNSHSVIPWHKQNLRLPNSLRFKVLRKDAEDSLRGLIYHMPCLPPKEFYPNISQIKGVWSSVHRFLDDYPGLGRV